MNDRELMQQALDALDYYRSSEDYTPTPASKAIAALRARPAQGDYDQTALELCEVCGWRTLIPGDCCLNCARLAQGEPPKPPDYGGDARRHIICLCPDCIKPAQSPAPAECKPVEKKHE